MRVNLRSRFLFPGRVSLGSASDLISSHVAPLCRALFCLPLLVIGHLQRFTFSHEFFGVTSTRGLTSSYWLVRSLGPLPEVSILARNRARVQTNRARVWFPLGSGAWTGMSLVINDPRIRRCRNRCSQVNTGKLVVREV